MEKELKKGFNPEDITNLAKGIKQITDEICCVLKIPKVQKRGYWEDCEWGLIIIIKSVVKDDIWKKCRELYERAVLEISNSACRGKGFKFDLQITWSWWWHSWDVPLNWGEEYTWDKTACREDPPNRACFEGNLQEVKKDSIMGSWGVLGKGYISPWVVQKHPFHSPCKYYYSWGRWEFRRGRLWKKAKKKKAQRMDNRKNIRGKGNTFI